MAEDNYKQYFAEKIWEMIPAMYRHEDGIADNPGVLRAIVEIMAEEAARLRRSNDRLWEDEFIELCNDWAVSYIGDLVGTRMVSALNSRARRVDVAKTIYYRRRKGTLPILEELISDITSWEGNVVEGFQRLARSRHGLDPESSYYLGRFTGTPPGGTTDLRTTHAAEMSHSAYDEFFHTPDIRKPKGKDGLYGIQRLLFYIHRIRAFEVTNVFPREITGSGGLGFTFDPSGRDIPLFMPRNRPQYPQTPTEKADWGKWHQPFPWELPAPMRCRLLGHAEYIIEDADIIELIEDGVLTEALGDELRVLSDIHFKSEQRLRHALSQLPNSAAFLNPNNYIAILGMALIDLCGNKALYPNAVNVNEDGNTISAQKIVAGDLSQIQTSVTDKRLQIDPERGRMLIIGDPPKEITATYHIGFSAEIGAGAYDRPHIRQYTVDNHLSGGGEIIAANLSNNGVTHIDDSATYGPVGNKMSITNLVFIAANQHRPYLKMEDNWVIDTGSNEDSKLELDGLWIGADNAVNILLRGNFEQVILRNITIDPGGNKTKDAGSDILPAVTLVIEGFVEKLLIESSIIGPMRIDNDGYIEKTIIKDSIIQNRDSAISALKLPDCELQLERVTVIGDIESQCLWATDSLIVGKGNIKNTQCGCFRLSAAIKEIDSRLPRPYRPVWLEKTNLLFTSIRFGDPGYMQLSEKASRKVVRGAENGAEMGAYNALINPIKLDSLRAKVEEYMPFGLLPVYIFET